MTVLRHQMTPIQTIRRQMNGLHRITGLHRMTDLHRVTDLHRMTGLRRMNGHHRRCRHYHQLNTMIQGTMNHLDYVSLSPTIRATMTNLAKMSATIRFFSNKKTIAIIKHVQKFSYTAHCLIQIFNEYFIQVYNVFFLRFLIFIPE